MQHTTIQSNTLQYSPTQYNTIQHTTIQCNTLQYNPTHYNTVQHTTIQSNTLQYSPTHYNTIQHTTIQCNTLQYNPTHYNTVQLPCSYLGLLFVNLASITHKTWSKMHCDYCVSLGWRGGSRVGGLNFITLYPVGPKHDRASPHTLPAAASRNGRSWETVLRHAAKL